MPTRRAMLHRIERRVEGLRAAVALYLAGAVGLAILAVAALVAVFAVLASLAGDTLVRADLAVLHALAAHDPPPWRELALDVTALGNTLTLVVVVACSGAGLWLAGRWLHAVVLAIAFGGGRLITEGIKAVFDRSRPEIMEWGTHVTSAAFPSAHAMSAAVVYGSLAYLLSAGTRPGVRITAWSVAVVLILGVATSRVALGVHFVSDVLGGITAGALWAWILLSALPAAQRLAASRRPV